MCVFASDHSNVKMLMELNVNCVYCVLGSITYGIWSFILVFYVAIWYSYRLLPKIFNLAFSNLFQKAMCMWEEELLEKIPMWLWFRNYFYVCAKYFPKCDRNVIGICYSVFFWMWMCIELVSSVMRKFISFSRQHGSRNSINSS